MKLKNTLACSLMILISFLSALITYPQVVQASPYTDITVDTAYHMITNGSFPDLVILDVRTQGEYDEGHIYKAVWIPHTELNARTGELRGHEDHEIIVYCGSGIRSMNASLTLESHNFSKIFNMMGGILDWESASYPTWISTVHNLNTTFNYDTIQAAIDAPQTLSGHTIYVEEGVYYEHVVLNKSLRLIGESQESTIIDGENIGDHEAGVVVLIQADNIILSNFTMLGSGCCGASGIYIKNCHDVTIAGNTVVKNNGFGIKLDNATKVSLRHNNVADNAYYAVQLINSSGNRILGNIVEDQSTIGIALRDSSNNTIAENEISNSTVGITFEASDDNLVFHNGFFNNTFHVQSVLSSNAFDNEVEGNQWDNYGGEDANLDGLGDSVHGLPDSNEDRYPLMGAFHSFSTSLGKNVATISNSTIKDLTYFESNNSIKIHVTNKTRDQMHGFIRVSIPHALITEPYHVMIEGVEPAYWNYTLYDNGTHRWLYVAYEHSTLEIIIIPEFPSLIVLPLFMLCTLLAAVFYRRKSKA